MKTFSIIFTFLSIISLRMCSDVQVHEDVELTVSPVYSNSVLKLTPVVTYYGEDPATFFFEGSIARVESVIRDGDVLYEYKADENLSSDTRSIIEKQEERYGTTIELEAEPGVYEIQLVSEYYMEVGSDIEGKPENKYLHELTQTIETKR